MCGDGKSRRNDNMPILHRAPVPTRYAPSGAAAACSAKTSKLATVASMDVIAAVPARCGSAS